MQKGFVTLLLICMAVTSATAATITVAKDGSGAVDNVQTAVAIAQNGDEIVITDSAIYEEDLIAGQFPGFAAQFTLKAAEGQNPVIRAVNQMERLVDLGVPGTDMMGTIIFGGMGIVIEGITFENLSTEVNVINVAGSLTVLDCSQTTIRNCIVRGAGGGPDVPYSLDNTGLVVAGVITAPAGVLIENTIVEECRYGVGLSKFDPTQPTDPTVTMRGCIVRNCQENGIEIHNGTVPVPESDTNAAGPGHLIEDTVVINCDEPISPGGGKTTIRNCTFLGNDEMLEIEFGEKGERPIIVDFEDVAIIGSTDTGIEVKEGTISLTRCIIAGCDDGALWLRADPEGCQVTVDHCDFVDNLRGNPDGFEVRVDPATDFDITLTITDSNILGTAGLYNGNVDNIDEFDTNGLTITNCNILTDFDRHTNAIASGDTQFDPLYVDPDVTPEGFTREGFYLQDGSPALSGASDGGAIGSQGPGPVGITEPYHWMWMIE